MFAIGERNDTKLGRQWRPFSHSVLVEGSDIKIDNLQKVRAKQFIIFDGRLEWKLL